MSTATTPRPSTGLADRRHRPGPLGRLADARLPPPRPDRRWPGSRVLLVAVGAVDVLRRRLQGRLLRPGLGLQRGPAAARAALPGPVRRHRRRRRPRRRRRDDPAAQADVQALLADARRRAARRLASRTRSPRPARSPPTAAPWSPTLRLDVVNPDDMPVEDSEQMLAIADDAEPAGLRRRARRPDASSSAEQGEIGSEGIGLAAATMILLLMFGSVVAAGLPILVAVAGLAVSGTLTGRADRASSTRPTGPPRWPR